MHGFFNISILERQKRGGPFRIGIFVSFSHTSKICFICLNTHIDDFLSYLNPILFFMTIQASRYEFVHVTAGFDAARAKYSSWYGRCHTCDIMSQTYQVGQMTLVRVNIVQEHLCCMVKHGLNSCICLHHFFSHPHSAM